MGEGSIGVEGAALSLMRRGAFLGDRPHEEGEWNKWVDVSSPHAPTVWKSPFPSLLVECVYYASGKECLCAHLREVCDVGGGRRKVTRHTLCRYTRGGGAPSVPST